MSLDVYLKIVQPCTVYEANITHNLGAMADAAGIYQLLWRPEEIGVTHARQLIEPLRDGIAKMKSNPEYFKTFNAPNGWGLYKNFLPWLEKLLTACEESPDAEFEISR